MEPTSRDCGCWDFCREILPGVSRSFALIIPMCPPPLDRALCVAYLLCRIADTIEDEPDLEPAARELLYDACLAAVARPEDPDAARFFQDGWPARPAGAEGRLIGDCRRVLEAFGSLEPRLAGPIRDCLEEMVTGMRRSRPVETRGGVRFLCADLEDLDRYCHYVAGTVGVMSSRLFADHMAPGGFRADDAWMERGRRMGLGLQMTNILKDCRIDAARGVSFVPASLVDLGGGGYRPTPTGLGILIRHTIGHLREAMAYVRSVPPGESGIRAFLLGSLLPAIATLEVAASDRWEQPKIDRVKMREIFDWIGRHAADNDAVAEWFEWHCLRTLAALA